VLLGEPPRTQWDLHFRLFGIPVRVHPFFWLIAALLGIGGGPELIDLFVWIAAVFVSVLVHELGHALVMRRLGYMPWITLYGMGGLAGRGNAQGRGPVSERTSREVLISAAGPGAQLAIVAVVGGGLKLAGHGVALVMLGGFLPLVLVAPIGSPHLTTFINYLLIVSVFWPVINLLPVYPLDGGQIARELMLKMNPWDGIRQSLILSLATAVGVAVLALLLLHDQFLALFFGYFAFSSYMMLQAHQGRGPW